MALMGYRMYMGFAESNVGSSFGKPCNIYDTYNNALDHGNNGLVNVFEFNAQTLKVGDPIFQNPSTSGTPNEIKGPQVDEFGWLIFAADDIVPIYFLNSRLGLMGFPLGLTAENNQIPSIATASSGAGGAIVTVNMDTTLDATHGTVKVNAIGSSITITLPTAASAFNSITSIGRIYNIKKIDSSSNSMTIDADGTELIDGQLTFPVPPTVTQYNSYTVQSDGVGWNII